MSGSGLVALLVRALAWPGLYLLLLLGRQQLERWLIARFQRRRAGPLCLPALGGAGRSSTIARSLAAAVGLLAGMAIPLAPDTVAAGQRLPGHVLGEMDASLLYALAVGWIGAGLAAWDGGAGVLQPGHLLPWRIAGASLLRALPALPIALSLILSAGALYRQASALSVPAMIAAQGGWQGMRWLAFLQPLALVLWLACTSPLPPAAQGQQALAWQVQALNWTLVTVALFFGGWQGPLTERYAGLGFLYTAAKAGLVTFVWTWVRANWPAAALLAQARAVWRVVMPLAALNLALTAAIMLI